MKSVDAVVNVWEGAADGRWSSVVGRWSLVVVPIALVIAATSASMDVAASAERTAVDTGTFSILGYDPATGEVGGAVQSRVFSVGNGVLWAEANVGIVATQAIVDVSYGPQALALLRTGAKPDAIVKQVWDKDPDPLPEQWTKQDASSP